MATSTFRNELRNFSSQSRMAMGGLSAIFFSIPFTLAGIFIILLGYDIIPVKDSNFQAPRHLIAFLGAIFFIAGEMIFFQGVMGMIRKARAKRHLEQNPGDRSGSDYPWDRAGIKGEGLMSVVAHFLGWCFFALFMVPFHWLFFMSDEKIPGFVYFVIGLFDLIVIGGFVHCVYLLIRYLRYGQSFLRFSRFPFQSGGTVEGTVIMAKPLKGVTKMKLTLRFVEEAFEVRGAGKSRSVQVVCYEVYNETIERTDFPEYGPDIERIPIAFNLPADINLKNDLASRPPRYWHLEVSATTPGVDYLSRFLVPVY